MKLIIAGATGYVGTEVIRQTLSNPKVTSIIALARRTTPVPDNLDVSADATKLRPVICQDFSNYTEDVKKELAGADACLWLVGVLPADLKSMPWDDVRKICLDYTVTGLEVLTDLPRDPGRKPLRFIYTSGTAAVRDPKLKPWVLGDYAVLRGECEVKALEAAEANSSKLETTIIKPGLITSTDPAHKSITASLRKAFCDLIGVPTIDLREMSACAINIAINGNSGKETHVNADMIDTGKKALEEGM